MVDRWTVVDEQAAIACAGSDARVFPTDLVTYVVGSAALVILLEPGDRPGGIGVQDFARVTLHPPIPPAASAYLVGDRRTVPFVLGFVRLPRGYLALGPMHVSMLRFDHLPDDWDPFDRGPAPGTVIEAGLSLAERMPFDLLDQVRPTHGGPTPSLDWLALLPADPIRALAAFVGGWFADLPPAAEAAGPAVVAVPEALAAFYRAVAGRCEILGYHRLQEPCRPTARHDRSVRSRSHRSAGADERDVAHVRSASDGSDGWRPDHGIAPRGKAARHGVIP